MKSEKNKDEKKGAVFNVNEKISEKDYQILIEPWITEKSHQLIAVNKYIFKIFKDANKIKVKRTIENLYNVKVIKVNIVNIPKKKRIYGRTKGWKSGFKKAVITLKEGSKIELFEGV